MNVWKEEQTITVQFKRAKVYTNTPPFMQRSGQAEKEGNQKRTHLRVNNQKLGKTKSIKEKRKR